MNAKNLYPDLFPETLLVNIEGEQVFTTSLKIAEYFKKAHRNIVRSIEKLLEELPLDAFNVLNFERVEYKDKKGEVRFMFKLNHDAFAILAMGFTGQKALEWKIKFLHAFREMETQLQERNNRWIKVIDQIRPSLRPVVEGTEQNLSRAEIAQKIGKNVGSVTYYRRRSRDLLH